MKNFGKEEVQNPLASMPLAGFMDTTTIQAVIGSHIALPKFAGADLSFLFFGLADLIGATAAHTIGIRCAGALRGASTKSGLRGGFGGGFGRRCGIAAQRQEQKKTAECRLEHESSSPFGDRALLHYIGVFSWFNTEVQKNWEGPLFQPN